MQPPRRAPVELRRDLPQHLEIGRGLELAGGDERLRADLIERVLELGRAVGGVDVDENEPDAGGRKLRNQPLGPVRGPDPDPVPPVEAEAEEPGREPVHPPGELLVGPALARGAEDGRGASAVAAHDLREEGGDGRVDERAGGRPPYVGEAVHRGDAPLPRPGRHLTRLPPRATARFRDPCPAILRLRPTMHESADGSAPVSREHGRPARGVRPARDSPGGRTIPSPGTPRSRHNRRQSSACSKAAAAR